MGKQFGGEKEASTYQKMSLEAKRVKGKKK